MNFKKVLIILLVSSFLISGILFVLTSKKVDEKGSVFPTPTIVPNPPVKIIKKDVPQSLRDVLEKTKIETSSKPAQDSKNELEKISLSLPFVKKQTLSTGIFVEIDVYKIFTNEPKWILPVDIIGIDFQIPEDDPEYEINKKSFLEASDILFNFLKDNDVKPEKIFINWGDRAFIQERAEKWLSEK